MLFWFVMSTKVFKVKYVYEKTVSNIHIFNIFILLLLNRTDNSEPIDKAEQDCISKTSDTQVMNQCSIIAQKEWEKEIKKTLSELKSVLDKESYKSLINSQNSWEKYKIDEFRSIDKMLENKQGTMYLNVNKGLKVYIVKQRALKLQEYLNTVND